MEYQRLMRTAMQARKFAYCPYSDYAVGAALLCEDGSIITGCNVENAAYGPTNCAERTAVFKAISEGKREFKSIAIAGGIGENLKKSYPCGVCRQVMAEFCDMETFEVICGTSDKDIEVIQLKDLIPKAFCL